MSIVLDRGREAAEEPVGFVPGARAKVEFVRASRTATVAECQSPELLDDEGPVIRAWEETVKLAIRPKRHDGAGPEVADQQLATVFSESGKRRVELPGSGSGSASGGRSEARH